MGTLIRMANAADAAGCLVIYTPFVRETAVSFEAEVPGPEAFAARIVSTVARTPWLVAEEGGAVRGYAYATAFRDRAAYQWSVETTVYVASEIRRSGLGRALYRNLLTCLRLQGYVNAYAVITLPNPGSVALHEALGFRPIGVLQGVGHKLGHWHDVGWWHHRLAVLPSAPAPPRAVSEVAASLRFEPWQPP